jgi:hypothetical protein
MLTDEYPANSESCMHVKAKSCKVSCSHTGEPSSCKVALQRYYNSTAYRYCCCFLYTESLLLLSLQIPAALCALAASSAFEWGIVRAAAGAATKILDDVAILDGGLPVRYYSKHYIFTVTAANVTLLTVAIANVTLLTVTSHQLTRSIA